MRKLIDMHVPIERAERMTVGQAGDRYAESREALGRSPVTVEDYRSTVRVHFDPFFGATSIDRVTPLDVEGYVAEKRRDGRSPKSVSNDQPEFEALLRACLDTEVGRQDRVMYLVAGMAGLRQAELLGLPWYSVDWRAMKIRAARDTFTRGRMRESGKSSAAGRGVPMAPLVARELELHCQRSRFGGDEELVFPNPLTGAPQ